MLNKRNLLVLAYSSNSCYTNLVRLSDLEERAADLNEVSPRDLKIDIEKKTWSFHGWKNIPVGEGREDVGRSSPNRWGIIGVYDQSNYEHIKELVSDAQFAVDRPTSALED